MNVKRKKEESRSLIPDVVDVVVVDVVVDVDVEYSLGTRCQVLRVTSVFSTAVNPADSPWALGSPAEFPLAQLLLVPRVPLVVDFGSASPLRGSVSCSA